METVNINTETEYILYEWSFTSGAATKTPLFALRSTINLHTSNRCILN